MKTTFNRIVAILGLAAAALAGGAAVPDAASADSWVNCDVREVIEKTGFVHVRCNNTWNVGSDAVIYFTIDKSSSSADEVSRFVSLATSAYLSGNRFSVYARSSSSYNPSGCGTSNCRLARYYGILK